MNPVSSRPKNLSVVLIVTMVAAYPVISLHAEPQERKVVVQPSELPVSIKKAVEKAVPDGEILKIEKEIEGEDPGQYDFSVRAAGKIYDVEISSEGEVIEVKERLGGPEQRGEHAKKWSERFGDEECTFVSTGANRYFILRPGHQLVLESRREKVTITVTRETKTIGGIETRIVEEREEENGTLKEVSRNYFAICKQHGDVYYFGEEVDIYKDGKVVKHEGAWRADEKDSRAGLMMPGTTLLGARHYQEISPSARDRAEIVGDDVTIKTPAGEFKNCIKIEETSGIKPHEKDYKTYAPGIGLVQDEDLLLTQYHSAAGR